jgi:hypothetical protein
MVRAAWWIVLGAAAGVVGIACSLNPQPLPPETFNAGGDAGSPTAASDGGAGTPSDATSPDATSLDGSADAPVDAPADGGPAGDAGIGDAATDGG